MQLTAEISNQIDRFLTGRMDQGEKDRFQAQMQMDPKLATEVEMYGYAIRAVQLEGRKEIRDLLENAREAADNPPPRKHHSSFFSIAATLLLLLLVAYPLLRNQRMHTPKAVIYITDVGLNGNLCAASDASCIPVSHINYYPEVGQFFYVAQDRPRLFPIQAMTVQAMTPLLVQLSLNQGAWPMEVTHNVNLRSASFAFSRRVGYKPAQAADSEELDNPAEQFIYKFEKGTEAEGNQHGEWAFDAERLAPDQDAPANAMPPHYVPTKVFPSFQHGGSLVNGWLPLPGQVTPMPAYHNPKRSLSI